MINETKESKLAESYDNVMLLTMSTLPSKPAMNTYKAVEGDREFIYKGISQLEPHTKHVITKLKESGERLNRIVILASPETRKTKEKYLETWHGETAISFFQQRIWEFLGAENHLDWSVEDSLEDKAEEVIPEDFYKDCLPEFVIVEMEDELFFWEAVQKILGNDRGRAIRLYMDMQGGDRNAVSQMNAIVTLLERQKVRICGRYANDYEPAKKLHNIREASAEYKTYELITAMEIFTAYGWGDKLENYFGKKRGASKETKLLKAISQASSAISMCNVDNFDNAVRKIADLREAFETSTEITQLSVVYENIKEEYEPLFDAKYRYVEQIRWCVKKNFIQQALTILEAKMPYEFVHSGLVYYFEKGQDKNRFFAQCEEVYRKLQSGKNGYKMKDLNHYFVKYYKNTEKNIVKKYGLRDSEEIEKCLENYKDICTMRNQINHASSSQPNEGGFFLFMKKKYSSDKNWRISPGRNYKKEILDFLKKWEELAEQVPQSVRDKVIDLS